MKCKNCGTNNKNNPLYCPKCRTSQRSKDEEINLNNDNEENYNFDVVEIAILKSKKSIEYTTIALVFIGVLIATLTLKGIIPYEVGMTIVATLMTIALISGSMLYPKNNILRLIVTILAFVILSLIIVSIFFTAACNGIC